MEGAGDVVSSPARHGRAPTPRTSPAHGTISRTVIPGGATARAAPTGPGGARLWVPENMAGIGDFADAALAGLRPEVLGADDVTREALQQLAAEAKDEDESAGLAG